MEKRLLEALKSVMNIVNESTGVAGYHLNGEIAEWDSFEEIIDADSLIAECEGKTHNARAKPALYKHIVSKRSELLRFAKWYSSSNVKNSIFEEIIDEYLEQ